MPELRHGGEDIRCRRSTRSRAVRVPDIRPGREPPVERRMVGRRWVERCANGFMPGSPEDPKRPITAKMSCPDTLPFRSRLSGPKRPNVVKVPEMLRISHPAQHRIISGLLAVRAAVPVGIFDQGIWSRSRLVSAWPDGVSVGVCGDTPALERADVARARRVGVAVRRRSAPRWSVEGGGQSPPASIAGLPASNGCVSVGPPLSARIPSNGFVFGRSPVAANPHVFASSRLWPSDVGRARTRAVPAAVCQRTSEAHLGSASWPIPAAFALNY